MSLAKKISELKPVGPGLPCGIGKILLQLEGEDREALNMLVKSPYVSGGVSNRMIFDLLDSEGYKIALASVRLHRSKQCRCYIGKNSIYRASSNNEKINLLEESNE